MLASVLAGALPRMKSRLAACVLVVVLVGFALLPVSADQPETALACPQTESKLVTVRVTPLPGLLVGDATIDGRVNVGDAVAIMRYTVGLRHLDSDESRCADTTGDGLANVADAVHIMQFTVDPWRAHGILTKPLWESPFDDDMLDPLSL